MPPVERPHLVIDLAAVASNWRGLAARAPSAECGAVCKADAYGLGAEKVVPALARAGARTFFTATEEEALAVRGILGPAPVVYALNGTASPDRLAAAGVRPVLSTPGQIQDARAFARAAGRPVPCAIHIDTGMNRLGLAPAEAEELARDPDASLLAPHLILSHLACADQPEHPANAAQASEFRRLASMLHTTFPNTALSLAATGGLLLGPDYHHDLVRPGIGLYGGHPYKEARPVLRLEAPILQIREIEPGQTVGYDGNWAARRSSRIATLALGYADGIQRNLSEHGEAWIDGVRAPFAGRVNMDLTTLDVTDVPEARPGTTVELLGRTYDINAMAEAAGTIGHEILVGLRGRYRRHYIPDQPAAGETP